jgi:hypothetical protein
MPRGDGRGPAGAGPMTGRGAGFCAGYSIPGYLNRGPGLGLSGAGINPTVYGRGRGYVRGNRIMGRGRGMRMRSQYPSFIPYTTGGRRAPSAYIQNRRF